MDYSIVYSSKTGNTALLAEAIKEAIEAENCRCLCESDAGYLETPVVFVGFWTEDGTCDPQTRDFLKTTKNKNIFLFGTAGYGDSQEYYDKILASVKKNIDASNKVIGTYMCQGKMDMTVRQRYEEMMAGAPADSKYRDLIENFDRAASHPDQADLESLKKQVVELISNL